MCAGAYVKHVMSPCSKCEIKQRDVEAEEAEHRPRTLEQEEDAEPDADDDDAGHDRDETSAPQRTIGCELRIEYDRCAGCLSAG